VPWSASSTILLADDRVRYDEKEVSMYHYNDFEAWRERQHDLLREAGE
jgi:hypothetical protein